MDAPRPIEQRGVHAPNVIEITTRPRLSEIFVNGDFVPVAVVDFSTRPGEKRKGGIPLRTEADADLLVGQSIRVDTALLDKDQLMPSDLGKPQITSILNVAAALVDRNVGVDDLYEDLSIIPKKDQVDPNKYVRMVLIKDDQKRLVAERTRHVALATRLFEHLATEKLSGESPPPAEPTLPTFTPEVMKAGRQIIEDIGLDDEQLAELVQDLDLQLSGANAQAIVDKKGEGEKSDTPEKPSEPSIPESSKTPEPFGTLPKAPEPEQERQTMPIGSIMRRLRQQEHPRKVLQDGLRQIEIGVDDFFGIHETMDDVVMKKRVQDVLHIMLNPDHEINQQLSGQGREVLRRLRVAAMEKLQEMKKKQAENQGGGGSGPIRSRRSPLSYTATGSGEYLVPDSMIMRHHGPRRHRQNR